MKCRNLWLVLVTAAAAAAASPLTAATLFFDDFSTGASAANYAQVTSGENAVTYAFDYSSLGIPPAPNTTDASTLGVKFESNMTSAAVAAVTLHTNQQFTGPYVVKFDAWINANGPFPGGGAGSTEFITAGVGGDGVTVNRTGATGSGAWTAADGEGGSTIDYRLFRNAALEAATSGAYAAGNHATSRAATDPYYAQFGAVDVATLPVQGANNGGPAQQTGSTIAGSFGFEWHEVKLIANPTGGTGGTPLMTWFIDGLRIGTLDAGNGAAFATDGRVTIGYMDPFSSVSDNRTLSFGLIDNLTVVPEPSCLLLTCLGWVAVTSRRRVTTGC